PAFSGASPGGVRSDGARVSLSSDRRYPQHRQSAAEGPGHRRPPVRSPARGGVSMISPSPRRAYFRHGLPYTDISNLTGTLITLEGTDGVGRSAQVKLLKEWLEVQGYG